MNEKCFLFLLLLIVSILFATDKTTKKPDTLQTDTTGIDSTSASATGSDTGKADLTVADSLLSAMTAKKVEETSRALTLPQLEIVSSQFVGFLDKALVLQGEELVFNAKFIVRGKAVYGHFDVMMAGDTGTATTVKSTDDRSYRSDKGGRPKTKIINLGPAAGCVLVKAAFHEMRVEPGKGLCVTGK